MFEPFYRIGNARDPSTGGNLVVVAQVCNLADFPMLPGGMSASLCAWRYSAASASRTGLAGSDRIELATEYCKSAVSPPSCGVASCHLVKDLLASYRDPQTIDI